MAPDPVGATANPAVPPATIRTPDRGTEEAEDGDEARDPHDVGAERD
jgi:hypothetical protein